MKRRELSDIMDVTRLQSELVNGWMLGLKASGTAPAEHYFPQQTDLNEIAESTSRLMIPYCRRFEVPRENIKILGRFPVLYMDSKAVSQVFMNIMGNAVKYSFQGRDFLLRVSAETVTLEELGSTQMDARTLDRFDRLRVRGGWLFDFADQGIGVSATYRERIFAAGVRDTSSEKVLSRLGAGLGLSVVRGIMRDHFGDAWLENLSRPTLFHVFFPDILKRDDYEHLEEWNNSRHIQG